MKTAENQTRAVLEQRNNSSQMIQSRFAFDVLQDIAPGQRLAVAVTQHPDQHRPKCSVLLAVDQELGRTLTPVSASPTITQLIRIRAHARLRVEYSGNDLLLQPRQLRDRHPCRGDHSVFKLRALQDCSRRADPRPVVQPCSAALPCTGCRNLARYSQHPDQHRSERPVFFAGDQQFGEGAALRVTPELADPFGALEVGEHQDAEQLGGALTYARPTPQSGALSQ
jgi:hypothetical protein